MFVIVFVKPPGPAKCRAICGSHSRTGGTAQPWEHHQPDLIDRVQIRPRLAAGLTGKMPVHGARVKLIEQSLDAKLCALLRSHRGPVLSSPGV